MCLRVSNAAVCCCCLQSIALYKWPALRLAFIPGIAEALFDAGVATAVFDMPFTLALSLSFILKAVGLDNVISILNRGLTDVDPNRVVATDFSELTDAQLAEAFVVKTRMAYQDMMRKGAIDEARAVNVVDETAAGDTAAGGLG